MKKFYVAVLMFMLVAIGLTTQAQAADRVIRLVINDQEVKTDVPPLLVNGRTMVPVRVVSENLGALVGWNGQEQRVNIRLDSNMISFKVGQALADVNGKQMELDAPAMMEQGRTLLPIRFVSENLGADVVWDSEKYEVRIKQKVAEPEPQLPAPSDNPSASSQPKVKITGITNHQVNRLVISVEPLQHVKTAGIFNQPETASTQKTADISSEKQSSEDDNTSDASSTTYNESSQVDDSQAPEWVQALGSNQNQTGQPASGLNQQKEDNQASGYQVNRATDADAKLKWRAFTMDNPDRLVLDITDAAVDRNFSPDALTFPPDSQSLIKGIRVSQYSLSPYTVRVVVDLREKASYTVEESNGRLTVQLGTYRYKVVVDAGHGGTDPGAKGVVVGWEKEFNLNIAKKVADKLNQMGFEALESRPDDNFISLQGRVEFANQQNADAFVSIHMNSFSNPKSGGTEVYYTREDSKALAETVAERLAPAIGTDNRGTNTANFYVIKNTTMPAILIETLFISNKEENEFVADPANQEKIAQAIADSIKAYFDSRASQSD
jgi:N-acetylmuramoyl-L-alanine amidase